MAAAAAAGGVVTYLDDVSTLRQGRTEYIARASPWLPQLRRHTSSSSSISL